MKRKKIVQKSFVYSFLLASFFFLDVQPSYAWLDGYSYKKTITVSPDNVNTTLTDFPLHVPIVGDADIGSGMKDDVNYYDIRFTDSDDVVLPYEQENMLISGGVATGNYWVKTDIDDGEGATLHVYYGKSGDTDGSNAEGVWNSGYMGVWHLGDGDDTSAGFYEDSSNNNNDGTLSDSDGDVSQTDARVGNGLRFTGDNDRINVGNDESLDLGSTFTLSGWIHLDSYDVSEYAFLIAKDAYPDGGSYDLGLKGNKPYTAISTNPTSSGWSVYTVDDVLPLSEWHYLTSVRKSDDTLTIYLDGKLEKSFSGVAMPAISTIDVTLGLRSVDSLNLHGSLDELRIENVSRGSEWIQFAHANMNASDNYEIAWSFVDGEAGPQAVSEEVEQSEDSSEDSSKEDSLKKADISSWKAEFYKDVTSDLCLDKVKFEIEGKHFDDDAKVEVGGKGPFETDRKSSKKIIARFCYDRFFEDKTSFQKKIRVTNPGADAERADEKIDVRKIDLMLDRSKFSMLLTEGVMNIQKALIRLGYLEPQYVTGFYGPITTRAVERFQEGHGIEKVGVVGPITRAQLEKEMK